MLLWVLLRLLIVFPLWLLGLALLLLGLALSPWGSGWLLQEGAKRGFYELGAVEGAPLDHLVLRELRLEAGPARIEADHLELAWADDCLLSGRLCLDTLRVEGARIRLSAGEADDTPPDPESGEPMQLRLPLPLEIRELSLDDVEVQLADGTRVGWESFTTGAVAEGDTARLLPTRLAGTRIWLPPSPGRQLVPRDDDAPLRAAAIDAAIAVDGVRATPDAARDESLPLAERPRLALPEVVLPLRVEVPELRIEDTRLEGAFEYAIDRLWLTLEGEGHDIALHSLEARSVDVDARLEAHVSLRDDYPLRARLESALWLPELMPELAGERVLLDLEGSLADLHVALDLSGPVEASLEARLDALDPTLPLEASLRSDFLRWPLPGAVPAEDEEPAEPWLVEDLSLEVRGSLLDYQVAATLRVEGPELPETGVALSGTGDLEHFVWQPLTVDQGEAGVVSEGRVEWAEALLVEARLRLDRVNPGQFVEGIDGELEGDIELSFAQHDEGWTLQLPQLAIDGELQELPLSLRARLAGDSDMRWQVETLDFRQGDNRILATGTVSEQAIDLAAEIELPALGSLHEELAGTLSGHIDAAGSLEAPRIDLDLTGDGLRFAENRLERLRLRGRVSGLDDPDMDLALDIAGIDAGGQRVEALALALQGRLSGHRLTLEASAGTGMPLSRAALALEGAMGSDRERYRGRLTPLEVDSEYGDLRLDDPMLFEADLSAGSARVQPFCLRRVQGGVVCLESPLVASVDQGQAALSLREVPMEMLEEWLPEEWRVSGATELQLAAQWSQGGNAWRAEVELLSELALAGLDAYGQPWELPPSRLSVDLQATPARADLALSLDISQAGDLDLTLGIEDPMGEGRMAGSLVLSQVRLDGYRTLVTGMETLEGQLNGEVQIAGTTQAPVLNGGLHLSGLRVVGYDMPLEVRDGELNVSLAGDQGQIQGFIAAEEGRLNVTGNASWPTPDDWRIAIDLEAREQPLLATLPAFGQLRVAPDLRVRIRPDLLQVRGDVRVPWARLEVGELPPSAVSPSPDEIIITQRDEERAQREAERRAAQVAAGEPGEDAAEALAAAGMEIDVRIELHLGPDMHLSAYGLESGLAGTLEVRQQNGPVQLFGDVSLVDGRFRAYGQDLLIREGEILFGGPADQPLLNFEAIRNPSITQDDVIAGLRVTGTPDAPELRVFSEPSMDEARALSYLLRGRPPGDGDADGALTSLLMGMALGQAGGTVGAIGEAFGISDLTLETAGAGDESQVVVAGQLSDDLRISYGVGVFSPIAELTLRYTLWRNLYLQAVSGAAQAVDLIYTFTRPGQPVILEP
ncbi:translocation/assembly module TamB [Halomonas sp. MCCC 1A11036]|uniref:Translocation/assembly module TamB n=1 Tax=Billgrantia zhangzhouensis TaxID=2733481 RepID=A0ABS9AAX3_9GAMM|nr:translocation/assembly module TamB domain-containing protein [Halomonas zhangzhouensis]MCE8019057.1 translocation/assembly module TamB [Halomonas zhangzhouensis]